MAEKLMPEQPNLPTPELPQAGELQEGQHQEVPAPQEAMEQTLTETVAPAPVSSAPAAPLPPSETVKSEALEAIEDIMEEDLADVYAQLPADRRQAFKEKGEETAEEIEGMMYKVKVKSRKVFKLLFAWLRIIPGVSKYFLEQEAKLKTDEIMHLKEQIDKQEHDQV